jgi:hypothetical protein
MATRRGAGEGSIYWVEAKQRWCAIYDHGYDPGGKRHRKKFMAKTKREAREKRKAYERQIDLGLPVDRADTTVNQLLDHYLQVTLPSRDRPVSPNTIDSYTWAFDKIRPALGSRRLRELTPEDVENMLHSYEGLAKSSLTRIRTCLGAALHEAERRSWVHRNVARLAHTPPAATTER